MLKVTVNNTQTLEVSQDKTQVLVNQTPIQWDFVQIAPQQYHIVYQNQSYNVEVVHIDFSAKTFTLKVNGKLLEMNAKDRFDLLLEQLGMGNASAQKVNDLKAPMPGLILQIAVNEGDIVKKGDTLLILEAMKMENVLKAQGDGIIKKIAVNKGERVEKNHLLIKFQ